MNAKIKEIVDLARANPKTSALGILGIAFYGAGDQMAEFALEPWASIVRGLGGLLLGIAWFYTRDSKPPAGDA